MLNVQRSRLPHAVPRLPRLHRLLRHRDGLWLLDLSAQTQRASFVGRFLSRGRLADLVGHRRFNHRLEHLGGTIHRHVGLGLCHWAGHLGLRMDRRGHARARRGVFDPRLFEEPYLHHAAVSHPALRAAGGHDHGRVLAARLRLRESDEHPLSGCAHRAKHVGIFVPGVRALPRRVCAAHHPRRHESHWLHRCHPGLRACARRAGHDLAGARSRRARVWAERPAFRLRAAARARVRPLSYDPAEGTSVIGAAINTSPSAPSARSSRRPARVFSSRPGSSCSCR